MSIKIKETKNNKLLDGHVANQIITYTYIIMIKYTILLCLTLFFKIIIFKIVLFELVLISNLFNDLFVFVYYLKYVLVS